MTFDFVPSRDLPIINKSSVLVVGAGGIGTELLKDLCLGGFLDISIIDLDTIELSNLNRQFLFRKRHIGLSKSQVAAESCKAMVPNLNVKHYHSNVMDSQFGTSFIRKFDLVINALDNLPARRHVNRLCLAADIPLLDSGTSGAKGQVVPIIPKVTECYDCQPKPVLKTYPVCTIRSNPSQPVHTIVWAKSKFETFFGDDDETSSAPFQDKESVETSQLIHNQFSPDISNETNFAQGLFNHFFDHGISDLLSRAPAAWKNSAGLPPVPISLNNVGDIVNATSSNKSSMSTMAAISTQKIPTLLQAKDLFISSSIALYQRKYSNSNIGSSNGSSSENSILVFDKDDIDALNFVHSASNLRSWSFHIPLLSEFDCKSIVGNIIPAIATSNAIIAGLLVIEAYKILLDKRNKCIVSFLNQAPSRGRMLIRTSLEVPNPKCFVCGSHQVSIHLFPKRMTLKTFLNSVLTKSLSFVEPLLFVGSSILYEGGEDAEDFLESLDKTLFELNITHDTILHVEDFCQNILVDITISDVSTFEEDAQISILGVTDGIIEKDLMFSVGGNVAQILKEAAISSDSNEEVFSSDESDNEIECISILNLATTSVRGIRPREIEDDPIENPLKKFKK